MKPSLRPERPWFSSGPCAKRPGWTPAVLGDAVLGRSHRAKAGKQRLADVIARSRQVLGMPDDWKLGIVPASDTGAFEMAMWNLLGPRPVDVFAWESFGETWAGDVEKHLKVEARFFKAPYGKLPDLAQADPSHDLIFTWNGTTSGVRVPDASWIAPDREGLALCDATSAVFAMPLDWSRLDVVTWSWQKALGGEAAHGMLALSPRAVARIESTQPPWPLPKIFRLAKGGKLIGGIFEGATINTPSLLCAEDVLDALAWAEEQGGLDGMIARSEGNLAEIAAWVERTPWVDFLAESKDTRSCTSICLALVAPEFTALGEDEQRAFIKALAKRLEDEGVAYDIAGYRDAPPGLRIWGGATVERADIAALLPWLDWAYAEELAARG